MKNILCENGILNSYFEGHSTNQYINLSFKKELFLVLYAWKVCQNIANNIDKHKYSFLG